MIDEWPRAHARNCSKAGGRPRPCRLASGLALALIWMMAGPARVPAQGGARAVLETAVTGFASDRSVASFADGRRKGIEVGDRFWAFRNGIVDATGLVHFVAPDASAGVTESGATLPAGRPVTILKSSALPSCRNELPPEVTIRGRIARVAPGRRTAWLDIGLRSGLRNGDSMLIRRLASGNLEVPLARGRLEIVREETALVVLQPTVVNTLPQNGDIAELWPSPADRASGRVESMVLGTRPASEPEGDLFVEFAGTPADGVEEKRLVDLFRGSQYIGHAAVAKVDDPVSEALMFLAGRRVPARVGDRAWVRPPPGPPRSPLSAAIFQIVSTQEGKYAQIAAGETDGVVVGEQFVVHHADAGDATIRHAVAELTIQSVHSDHSTAHIRLIGPKEEPVQVWDFAERVEPPLPQWRAIGIVAGVVPETRSASAELEQKSTATVGRVVRLIPEDSPAPDAPIRHAGAAIVISRSGDEAALYVPPGWGNVPELINARVELADAPATQPAASR